MSYSQFSPPDVPGLKLWLKADLGITKDINDKVSQWDDQSGQGNHATQTTPSDQPLAVNDGGRLFNNLPVINFTNSRMNLPATTLQTGVVTVFVVYKISNTAGGSSGYSCLISLNNGIEYWTILADASYQNPGFIGSSSGMGQGFSGIDQIDTLPHMFGLVYNGGNVSLSSSYEGSYNGFEKTIVTLPAFGSHVGSVIGDRDAGGYFLQGNIAEIIAYDVVLSLTDRQQVEQYLHIKYAPPVDLGPDITSNYLCDTLLDASSRFLSYLWSTGATNQTINITQSGTYSVVVTDAFGAVSSDVINVSFPGNFSPIPGNATSVCAGNIVSWNTNLSPASSYTFAWSTGATTSAITINSAGQYSVAVTDMLGCTRTSATMTVTVDSYSVSLGPDITMCSGNSIALTSGAGQTVSYQWSTGATTSSIVINMTGTNTYSVVVQNANGCTSKDTIDVTILGTAPTVSFSFSTTCEGDAMQFIDLSTSGDGLASWNWDFGDASTDATVQHPLHLYPDSGTYMVSITVTTTAGCSQIFSQNIKIYPLPQVDFSSSIASVGANTTLTDQSNSFGYPLTGWTWASNGNNFSSVQNPVHQFSVSGTHTVKLVITTQQGCKDWITKNIMVYNDLPSSLPRIKLWLAADNGVVGGNISQWDDQSGQGNDAVQATPSDQPLYISDGGPYLNNLPVVRFNTSRMNLPNFITTPSGKNTSFIVYKVKDINGGVSGFSAIVSLLNGIEIYPIASAGYPSPSFIGKTGGPNGQRFSGIDIKDTIPHLLTVGYNGNDISSPSSYYGSYNGIDQTIVSIGAFGNRVGSTIGDRDQAGFYFKGDIAEIVVYDTTLTLTERQQVEQYLHDKYAPPVYLGADVTVASSLCAIILDASLRFVSYAWSTGASTQTISVNQSGTYSVVVTDVFGITSSDAVNITYPGNFSPFPGNATTICAGSTTTWNTNLTPASSYTFAWSTGATTSAITINSAGTYSVLVTDQLGCTRSSSTVTVTVDNYPQTTSLGPPITACAGVSLSLASGAGQTTSYQWSTGATTSSIVLSTQGINTYSVLATNGNGCTATPSVTVNVKGYNPVPSFTTSPACLGSASTFVDGSTVIGPAIINGWSWNFGPSTSTSSVANPVYTYTASGSYTITLTVTTDSGCSASIQKVENVFAKPNAGHSVNTLTPDPCSGASVTFTDGSSIASGTLNTWSWNFGDASTSSAKNPIHTYTAAGTYMVTQIVTSGLGCKDTVIAPVTVMQSPGASFTADTVCKGFPTSFTNTSAGSISGSVWSFGDGSNSSLQNPAHTYTFAGAHNATLVVTDANGCTGSKSGIVLVNYLPVVSFSGDSVCVNVPLQFNDSSTVQGSSISGWEWDFGNGDSSLLQNPMATYTAAGAYNVSLIATSAQGCSLAGTQTVTVMPLPIPNFSMSTTYSYPQVPVYFTDLSSGAVNQNWYFGDGTSTSSVPDPTHTYTATGMYTITLVTQSAFGCVDSFKQTISIDEPLLDIGIKSMLANNSSGVIQVSCELKNYGTLDVTTIELSAYMDDGTPIHEFWTGFAAPDSSVPYSFTSSFELVNNKHSIVCVEVKKVNGQQDAVSANNIQCVAITDEFTLLNPFPNPASEEVYFIFVVPDASDVLAEVLDARGRVVATPYNGKASKGLNKVAYNTLKLEKGMYWVKLSYKDKVITKPFIKE